MRRKKEKRNRFEVCVARGVKFLNKEYGKSWLRDIDAEALALRDGCACIIGQLEGSWSETTLEKLGLNEKSAERLGFTISFDHLGHGDAQDAQLWNNLTDFWRAALSKARRRLNQRMLRPGR